MRPIPDLEQGTPELPPKSQSISCGTSNHVTFNEKHLLIAQQDVRSEVSSNDLGDYMELAIVEDSPPNVARDLAVPAGYHRSDSDYSDLVISKGEVVRVSAGGSDYSDLVIPTPTTDEVFDHECGDENNDNLNKDDEPDYDDLPIPTPTKDNQNSNTGQDNKENCMTEAMPDLNDLAILESTNSLRKKVNFQNEAEDAEEEHQSGMIRNPSISPGWSGMSKGKKLKKDLKKKNSNPIKSSL